MRVATNVMLLTDEEMRAICYGDEFRENVTCEIPMAVRYSAKAQLKKVMEWGKEKCPHFESKDGRTIQKRACYTCWQTLVVQSETEGLKEIE